ncbi:FLX-like 2-like protein [Drosera capensis]
MTSRGHPPAPGMMRHGLPPGVSGSSRHHVTDPLYPAELAEQHILAEMDLLVEENRRLAASQVPLRRELVIAQDEIQKVKAHIKSIQTESEIQMRVLIEKMSKMEADVRAGTSVRNDLQQAHSEAQKLVATRKELTEQVEKATQELEKARDDIKKLPDMLSELDNLTLEHQKLRSTFEHQKHENLGQVEQLRAMESGLVGMAREVERLRAAIGNAEKRVQDPSYAVSTVHANGPYYDSFMRPHMGGADGMISYGVNANGPWAVGGGAVGGSIHSGGAVQSGGGDPLAMVGDYDPDIARR